MAASTDAVSGLLHSWTLGESGWNVGMDTNILTIGRALTHLAVKDKDLSTPPVSPVAGDRYIVGAAPTGAWSGWTGRIAVYTGSAWISYTPKNGWRCYVDDEKLFYIYDTSAWRVELRLAAGTPASPTATGAAGESVYDSSYLYVCVATNTWKRIPYDGTWV